MELRELVVKLWYESGLGKFWYIATPYSKYPEGLQAAFEHACIASAWLVKRNVRVYSPIAHTHAIAHYGLVDALDHEIWMWQDEAFMENACGLLVVDMPGWNESVGVIQEIRTFGALNKPIYHLPWPLEG